MTERKPEEVWKALVDEAEQDGDVERAMREVEAMSDAEKAAALKEAGAAPAAISKTMGDLLAKHEVKIAPEARTGATAEPPDRGSELAGRPKPRRGTAGSRWTPRRLLLAAAAVAVPAATYIATQGPPLVGRAPSPHEMAAETRARAFAACDAARWTECEQGLDEAKAVDPAGDDDARVRAARQRIEESRRRPSP
jgi:hypothetical protein